jgi:BirA family transcriptional regulator, biotin operon repressor / biotin---[acetyl-CoA-carboxylase] ligase
MRPFFFIICETMHNQSFQIPRYQKHLQTRAFGRAALYFQSIGSTSTYLKRKSPRVLTHGMICIADHQTEGRGQYNRLWLSEPNANLMFTIILKPRDVNRIQILPLLAGCAIVKVIQESSGVGLKMKWPNDIVNGSSKLGGVLAESVLTGSLVDKLMIGIGINVNQTSFDDSLPEATSLQILSGAPFDRESLLAGIMDRFEEDYRLWEEGDIQVLRCINRHITGYGDWCGVEINGKRLSEQHKILGIDPRGFLLALDSNDTVKTFTHEHVRILPG